MPIQFRFEEKFVLFDTPEECADAAAPVFVANRWRWASRGIPSREDIFRELVRLRDDARTDTNYRECGRLVFDGRNFGYQRTIAERKALHQERAVSDVDESQRLSARRYGLVPMTSTMPAR